MGVLASLAPDIQDLVLEGDMAQAVQRIRATIGLGLRESKAVFEAAEDELGLIEQVTCLSCGGAGTRRRRKAEYPAKRPEVPPG